MNYNQHIECRSCVDCGLRSPMFDHLSAKELQLINEHRFEIKFNKGEIIRKQGTFLSHVISLNSGLAKLYIEGLNSKNLILRIIKPTRFIGGPGMYYDQRHHYTVAALIDTSACFIEINIFKEIIHSNPVFAAEFMKEFSINMLSTYDRLINITQKQIPGRMADALLYFSDEIFDNNKIASVISKQDLADLTSMSKDSAVKILREFNEEGIIKTQPDFIEITDKEALIKISKFG
ncbi:MAG: Crp/Fnr family transcriptional regulator [Bacteroidales bacterium]|nr:Crp/Fnr family transcriptional regulator [Bacteroidales bacterium]